MPRQTSIRHLLRLRTVIEGISPPIIRELTIDRDADAGELARVLTATFALSECTRHEFTDSRDPYFPAHTDLAELSEMDLYEHERYVGKQWPRLEPDRRWGDRWTMIDARDPQMTFETSVRVAEIFRSRYEQDRVWSSPWHPLGEEPVAPRVPTVFFRCDSTEPYSSWRAGRPWWIRLELVGDDIDVASAPVAQLVGGSGTAPFDGEVGAHRHAKVLAQWRDPDSPEHAEAQELVAKAVGPWVTFDPDAFDLDIARADLDAALGAAGGPVVPPGAARMLERVAPSVRPGLRRHLGINGIGLPPVITAEEAEQAVAPFRRVLAKVIGREGRAFDEAAAEVADFVGGADATDVLELLRRLGLIYRRSGNWRVKLDALEAASDPLRLWCRLAREVAGMLSGTGQFLLLALADGTIADEDAALERIAAVTRSADVGAEWSLYSARAWARGGGLRAELDELHSVLQLLLWDVDGACDFAASETVREFARTCLQ